MSTPHITSIHLTRFRQFADTRVDLSGFDVLVGANNSGKTSLLHAIRAFFALMNGHVRFKGKPLKADYHRRFLSGDEERDIAPSPSSRELWFGKSVGNPIELTVKFGTGEELGVLLKNQFGQVHVSSTKIPVGFTEEQVRALLDVDVAFIPGLVGVLVDEHFATAGRRVALASQGRYAEIFRSSLFQLKEGEDGVVDKLNDVLRDFFDVELDEISFDMAADEHVTVTYKQPDGLALDVVSAGSGLQQLVQILTYLYLSKPRILLVDEPDAHLHSRLQALLAGLFKRVAEDIGAQVLISTHSVDLIDSCHPREVIVVDSSEAHLKSLNSNDSIVDSLVSAGVVDTSSLTRILASKNLVFVEDRNKQVLRALDRAASAGLFTSATDCQVIATDGVGNFDDYATTAKTLQSFSKQKINIMFLQDRDGLPDMLEAKYLTTLDAGDARLVLMPVHEPESYLCRPSALVRAALSAKVPLTEEAAEAAVLEAAKDLKQDARSMCLDTARRANKRLAKADRLEPKELEKQTNAWFDSLQMENVDEVLRVWPGKELLTRTRHHLKTTTGKDITQGRIVANFADSDLPPGMRTLLTSAGATTPGRPKAKKAAKKTGPKKAAKKAGPRKAAKKVGPKKAAKKTGPKKAAKKTGPKKAAKKAGPKK